jgi:hypothetical protein
MSKQILAPSRRFNPVKVFPKYSKKKIAKNIKQQTNKA